MVTSQYSTKNFLLIFFFFSNLISGLLHYLHAFLHYIVRRTKMAKIKTNIIRINFFDIILETILDRIIRASQSKGTSSCCKNVRLARHSFLSSSYPSKFLRRKQEYLNEPMIPMKMHTLMAVNISYNRSKMVLAAIRINCTSVRHHRLLDSQIQKGERWMGAKSELLCNNCYYDWKVPSIACIPMRVLPQAIPFSFIK